MATISTQNGHSVVSCSDPSAASSVALMRELVQANNKQGWADMVTVEGMFSVRGSFNQLSEAVKTFHANYVGESEAKQLEPEPQDRPSSALNRALARAFSRPHGNGRGSR